MAIWLDLTRTYWQDTSEMIWHAAKISINVIAEKCFDV